LGWAQVDALTIPRYRALKRYWQDYPPVNLLLRALLGVKPSRSSESAASPFDALAALAPAGTLNVANLARAKG
jgi:hypothetical protein